MAFDAGNMLAVASALAKRYRGIKMLLCADDDVLQKCRHCKSRLVLADHPQFCPSCAQPHGASNAGLLGAEAAALDVGGAVLHPVFADEPARREHFIDSGRKVSDFNDLHAREGLHVVRAQVEARLTELSWRVSSHTQHAIAPLRAALARVQPTCAAGPLTGVSDAATTIRHRELDRQQLADDLDGFLAAGGRIEVLGHTPIRPLMSRHASNHGSYAERVAAHDID